MRRLAVTALLAIAGVAGAQGSGMSDCELSAPGGFQSDSFPGQPRTARGTGGITVTCPRRNLKLTADSGSQNANRIDLYGHVHYDEPSRIDLHSDFLTYTEADQRVHVTGRVVAVLPSGSRLTGPDVVYLRVVPNSRPFEEMTAINKPTVTIVSAGDTAKTVTLNANTIYMRGDSLTYASRNVIIVRNDMVAHGDSAFLDGRTDHETIRLMFKPKVQGTTGRKFELEGDIVDAYSKSKKLERVVARGNARATSRDLEITSDTIDLRMSNDYLEHAFAWSHPGLAKAKSPGQSIVADSIDVTMPKQRVQVVRAFRRAFAQADADSTKFRTTEKDWLSGDTVVAWFDSAATTKDTNATPPLKQILATHVKDSARAYYHLVATDTAAKVPAIGYVRGREIQLDFDDHKIGRIAVRDSVAGIYLEPRHDTASTTTKGKANAKPQTKPPTKPPTTTPPKKPPVELPEPRQRPDLAGGRPRDSFLS